jgi:hypothetical protein
MTITANSGPYLAFGITQTASGLVNQYNEERGPSVFDLGQGTLDPRSQFNYRPGSPVGTQIKVLFDQTGLADYIPFTAGASAIALSTGNTPVSGAALTLAPVSSLGAFQTTIIAPELATAVSAIAIDSTAATLNFGTGGTVACWNPTAGTGRAIVIIGSCASTEGYFVRGRDMYGFKMTELISASTTSTGSGQGRKAFKYVQSVTASTSSTFTSTGISVGFADIFGYPLVANYLNGISVWTSSNGISPANIITLSTANSVTASTIVTQTSTTPDVRGTYASSIATNGTSANGANGGSAQSTGVRVTILQYLTASQLAGVTATSATTVFGQAQFSDF